MDPWSRCQADVTVLEQQTILKFEDNFQPLVKDTLPDSAQYLATLEEKLRRIKNDPDVLRQLQEKREACMQQLLNGCAQFEDDSLALDAPVTHSQLLRSILPQKQALVKGEVVELVKYDQLSNEEPAPEVNKDTDNRNH